MPNVADWSPYTHRVQGGLREGNFINSQFALICAGPPFMRNLSSSIGTVPTGSGKSGVSNLAVYPIGLVQSMSLGQSKNFSRFFEIGSDRAYFISGRSVGQMSLGRVLYHGPNLLRALMAYYDTSADETANAYKVKSLFDTTGQASPFGVPPFSNADLKEPTAGGQKKLHSVKVPPGYENFFMNLASDLFSQPMGLLFILKDNNETTYGAFYLEQCYIPSHQFGFESQGLIVQESCSIQYERLVPIRMAQLDLVRDIGGTGAGGFIADDFGGFGGTGSV